MRPSSSFYAAPNGFKDMWSPLYPVLLFWRLQTKWICAIILEKCPCIQYFYSRINNNQMQRKLFENEFDTPAIKGSTLSLCVFGCINEIIKGMHYWVEIVHFYFEVYMLYVQQEGNRCVYFSIDSWQRHSLLVEYTGCFLKQLCYTVLGIFPVIVNNIFFLLPIPYHVILWWF